MLFSILPIYRTHRLIDKMTRIKFFSEKFLSVGKKGTIDPATLFTSTKIRWIRSTQANDSCINS